MECLCRKDENGCDNTLEDLIYSLSTGLLVFIILAGILEFRKEWNKITNDTELTDFRERDRDMEALHEADDKGNRIAFWQGSDNRIEKNRALIDFEASFHGSHAKGMHCIKVKKNKCISLGFLHNV